MAALINYVQRSIQKVLQAHNENVEYLRYFVCRNIEKSSESHSNFITRTKILYFTAKIVTHLENKAGNAQ